MFDIKEIQKVEKKLIFPDMHTHPERTGLKGKTSNAQQRNTKTDTKFSGERKFQRTLPKKIP